MTWAIAITVGLLLFTLGLLIGSETGEETVGCFPTAVIATTVFWFGVWIAGSL